jgi:hypothetical protein
MIWLVYFLEAPKRSGAGAEPEQSGAGVCNPKGASPKFLDAQADKLTCRRIKDMHTHTCRHTGIQTDRQANRQTDKRACIQAFHQKPKHGTRTMPEAFCFSRFHRNYAYLQKASI